ncbi:uberolysin/carnocyclin family circular bacteriocin [Bacillus cereus group sp. Bc252]|uniref:uberolysin/carnocyclin family circular bacteriocin n=1 Tax=Bacillus cereus group sp. Bc252 TaxID=3018104 RepID=UPI0022E8E28B|nr:uberolysin/carnocyclin family circular bacteriocin [Bacillus cereus group sp. Bc252]MDA2164198.1 uberolysin/carnocyclin family circular bacteriocin [Bacillus cereus group sp. Bc252]
MGSLSLKNNVVKVIAVMSFLLALSAILQVTGASDASTTTTTIQSLNNSFGLELASMLKISERTAMGAMTVILATSDILTAISLCAAVLGGTGLITAGMVQTAKYLAKNKGKKYAAQW